VASGFRDDYAIEVLLGEDLTTAEGQEPSLRGDEEYIDLLARAEEARAFFKDLIAEAFVEALLTVFKRFFKR
jgi:hypothetical protein